MIIKNFIEKIYEMKHQKYSIVFRAISHGA